MKRHVAGGECWDFTSTAAVGATNGTDETCQEETLTVRQPYVYMYIYIVYIYIYIIYILRKRRDTCVYMIWTYVCYIS